MLLCSRNEIALGKVFVCVGSVLVALEIMVQWELVVGIQ